MVFGVQKQFIKSLDNFANNNDPSDIKRLSHLKSFDLLSIDPNAEVNQRLSNLNNHQFIHFVSLVFFQRKLLESLTTVQNNAKWLEELVYQFWNRCQQNTINQTAFDYFISSLAPIITLPIVEHHSLELNRQLQSIFDHGYALFLNPKTLRLIKRVTNKIKPNVFNPNLEGPDLKWLEYRKHLPMLMQKHDKLEKWSDSTGPYFHLWLSIFYKKIYNWDKFTIQRNNLEFSPYLKLIKALDKLNNTSRQHIFSLYHTILTLRHTKYSTPPSIRFTITTLLLATQRHIKSNEYLVEPLLLKKSLFNSYYEFFSTHLIRHEFETVIEGIFNELNHLSDIIMLAATRSDNETMSQSRNNSRYLTRIWRVIGLDKYLILLEFHHKNHGLPTRNMLLLLEQRLHRFPQVYEIGLQSYEINYHLLTSLRDIAAHDSTTAADLEQLAHLLTFSQNYDGISYLSAICAKGYDAVLTEMLSLLYQLINDKIFSASEMLDLLTTRNKFTYVEPLQSIIKNHPQLLPIVFKFLIQLLYEEHICVDEFIHVMEHETDDGTLLNVIGSVRSIILRDTFDENNNRTGLISLYNDFLASCETLDTIILRHSTQEECDDSEMGYNITCRLQNTDLILWLFNEFLTIDPTCSQFLIDLFVRADNRSYSYFSHIAKQKNSDMTKNVLKFISDLYQKNHLSSDDILKMLYRKSHHRNGEQLIKLILDHHDYELSGKLFKFISHIQKNNRDCQLRTLRFFKNATSQDTDLFAHMRYFHDETMLELLATLSEIAFDISLSDNNLNNSLNVFNFLKGVCAEYRLAYAKKYCKVLAELITARIILQESKASHLDLDICAHHLKQLSRNRLKLDNQRPAVKNAEILYSTQAKLSCGQFLEWIISPTQSWTSSQSWLLAHLMTSIFDTTPMINLPQEYFNELKKEPAIDELHQCVKEQLQPTPF